MDRRSFLLSMAGAGGLALLGQWDDVLAAPGRTTPLLVVVHLAGGNDGLNTIVPSDRAYRTARPTLALGDALPLRSGLGMNPAMAPLHALYQRRLVAVVNGVGYDHPNRSHFRSAEIWQTADPVGAPPYGWLGRYLDVSRQRGVCVDATLNRSLWAKGAPVLSVDTPEAFRFTHPDPVVESALSDLYRDSPPHLADTWHRLDDAVKRLGRLPKADGMPGTDAGKALRTVLQLMPTAQVYHVTVSGFDTHIDQRNRQAKVWQELSEALSAFWSALEARGLAVRTTLMLYSEFGRRVEENASGGTDHGTAGPVFLVGHGVRAGLSGAYPSLSDLDEGDLRHSVDFRSVYAGVLEGWLGTRARDVLGPHPPALPLFA